MSRALLLRSARSNVMLAWAVVVSSLLMCLLFAMASVTSRQSQCTAMLAHIVASSEVELSAHVSRSAWRLRALPVRRWPSGSRRG